MDVSIVIATKDRASYLERALASLETQTDAPRFEAIVVDNGSTDRTKDVAEAFARRTFPVRYVAAPQPNRGAARNRGVAQARGEYLLFCDDDVQLPARWIASHLRAHGGAPRVVNGPILNVPSYDARPMPGAANYSRAFLCTCNASMPKAAFVAAGGFDENFRLYGWEDTELGVRLRAAGLQWKFAWEAYLWHIKAPEENTLAVESRKVVEKARMARRFLAKHPSRRARLATGAHAFNLLRARYLTPEWLVAIYGGLAESTRLPRWTRSLVRTQFLDALYARELVRVLKEGDG
jgi:glycosyltransferase involved in cell wall biosynthesis